MSLAPASMDNLPFAAPAGYTLPAEWEPQDAVWFSWPVSHHIWPGRRAAIWHKFGELVAAAAQFQDVYINADPAAHADIGFCLGQAGVDMQRVVLFPHPTNDVWCRDHGPIFLRDAASRELLVGNWQFNAWGGKFRPYDLDDAVPQLISETLDLPRMDYPYILEGGAIESNGAGVLLTTGSVILNPNREPAGLSREAAAARLCAGLGMREVVWLEDGLPNDDTDGHIDNLARFYAADAVVAVEDPALPLLAHNLRLLRDRFGTVRTLPRPDTDGPPRSYANFLVLNGGVLVPTFGQAAKDDLACGVIAECFPGRTVLPIDCRLLLEEGGAIHCLTMQQPSGPPPVDDEAE
jgi:agmatine deiminase